MLTATPAASKRPVNASGVYCARWSVLKISGRPSERAASKASRQNSPSSVFDRRHEGTLRLNQSITTVRRIHPYGMGTNVISLDHTWSGRTIATFRSKYG